MKNRISRKNKKFCLKTEIIWWNGKYEEDVLGFIVSDQTVNDNFYFTYHVKTPTLTVTNQFESVMQYFYNDNWASRYALTIALTVR